MLQNLAWVKSFTICIELDDNSEIFCQLFRTMFEIVDEKHSNKVTNFVLDLLTPLIQQSDTVSQELMDIILAHIVEPFKVCYQTEPLENFREGERKRILLNE